MFFFDVDHTITASATSLQYLFQGITRRYFPLRPIFSVPRILFRYRGGNLSVDTFLLDGIPFIIGKSRQMLEQLAVTAFHKRIKNHIYHDAYTLIKSLQQKGKQVILATSSIDFIIAPLLQFLDIKTGICSSLTFTEGLCTGQFQGPLTYGVEKKRKVLAYIREQQARPADCYFYSDSINDLPLLLAVGHPVAVNPDKKLEKEARNRDWQIMRFSRKL